jgi:hypothetical protein
VSAADEIVNLLSSWLAFHRGNADLRAALEAIGTAELAPGAAEAVDELLDELARSPEGQRGDLEMLARETLEAVALEG